MTAPVKQKYNQRDKQLINDCMASWNKACALDGFTDLFTPAELAAIFDGLDAMRQGMRRGD